MIEKFSEEELKIIRRELREKELEFPYSKSELHKYLEMKLEDVLSDFDGKNTKLHLRVIDYIPQIADMTFKNYEKAWSTERLNACKSIDYRYSDEYREMCDEIVEIIKKHNKKWESDNNAST